MSTIIFDLDGTLSDLTHRLKYIKNEPKNWDAFHLACSKDSPKQNVLALFRILNDECEIKIVSGRNDSVRDLTVQWLKNHGIAPGRYELIMRPEGDHTPGDELKETWLKTGILGPIGDIWLVFDDRQRVVDMWRRNGLTCLQVEAWSET